MVTETSEKPAARHPATGWSEARRRPGTGPVRTWVPAVEDPGAPRATPPGREPEPHIVRGED
ncbi:hypothetical protein [Streptomyces sp. NPDC090994]|uniref:hypothetical protein n=1 Tax=Streptomyces sp. NPDC090994 TaxID=3365969 RepID=UPI0038180917